MNLKKLFSFLAISPVLLTSCSSFGTHFLVRNIDACLSGTYYEEFTVESFEFAKQMNYEFVVFMASTGCSACDEFEPEFKAYLDDTHFLTYKFDAKDNKELEQTILKDYQGFCEEDGRGTKYLSYPSLFIVKGEEITPLPQNKLKNKAMISNTFREYVHDTFVFYGNGDVINKMVKNGSKVPFREFGYVSFDFNNQNLMDYFKKSIQGYITDSGKVVVVTNFNEIDEYIAVKKATISEDGLVGIKSETMSKDTSNLDYVKSILS